MRYARPRARGRNRFRVGPSSTYASATKRVSAGSCWLCSALAIAESSTFLTGTAAARGVNWSTRRASSTWRPRMRSMTRRALNGETRTNRACALTPRFSWAWAFSDISLVPLSSLTTSAARAASANPGRPLLGAVDAEGPGRRELAELVADHRLGDVHGHVLAPIVDRDRVPDHVGDDRGAPRPGLDDPLVAPAVQLVDLLQQVVIHKGALFQRASHRLPSPPLAATAEDELVGGLVAVAGATLRLAPRAHRVAATRALALATAERVVDRVHGHAARLRALAAVAVAAGLAPADQVVLGVADLTDRGAAGHLDLADLAGGHAQGGPAALLGQQLDRHAGGAAQLGAAAAVPRGDAAVHVAATRRRRRRQQRLLRARLGDLGEVGPGSGAPPGRRWLVVADTHLLGLEELDLVVRVQGHQRPLGRLAHTHDLPGALVLALAVQGVHVHDADRENGLHGLLDLGLVRVGADDEGVGVAVEQRVGLLAHDRLQDDVPGVLHDDPSPAVCAPGPSSRTSSSSVSGVVPRPRKASSDSRLNTTVSLASTS